MSASMGTLIDLNFSCPIAKSDSLIISQSNIYYLPNNCKMKKSEMTNFDTRVNTLSEEYFLKKKLFQPKITVFREIQGIEEK